MMMTTTHTTYPLQLVAKIYNPMFFDNDKTQWNHPFFLWDLSVPSEMEEYQQLGPLQEMVVPRFYGYFAAALPAQHGRTVYLILLEEVPGRDLHVIVPSDAPSLA